MLKSKWEKYRFEITMILLATLASVIVGWIKDITSDANKAAPKSYVDQELRKKADIVDVDYRCKELEKKIEKKADSNVLNLILQNLSDIKKEQQSLNEYIRRNK